MAWWAVAWGLYIIYIFITQFYKVFYIITLEGLKKVVDAIAPIWYEQTLGCWDIGIRSFGTRGYASLLSYFDIVYFLVVLRRSFSVYSMQYRKRTFCFFVKNLGFC